MRSRELIKTAIQENEFLGNLDKTQVESIISAMHPEEIHPDTRIIREGDTGTRLYVSAEGEFDVYDGERYQGSFGPGVAFGELAMLYHTKRLRSVDVKQGGKVWVLERDVFQTVMAKSIEMSLQNNIRLLRRVSAFKNLPDRVLAKISELICVEFFQTDDRIVRQGDEGDKFYVINGGHVRITRRQIDGEEEELMVLGQGDYFGERALFEDSPRQASATALAPGVECFTIDKTSFLNYLGGLEEILNKDWEAEYEKRNLPLVVKWISAYPDLKLSDLEVIETLGVGSFGTVELVVAKSIPNQSFALKKVRKDVITRIEHQRHVYNEKQIMQACRSPFICKLYKTFKNTKYVYFLMEACLGGDLCTTLHRKRHFNTQTVQFMLGCVVEALEHLHTLDIVYRDLKLENIMIDHRGYLKLTDFGFSKRIGPDKTWTFAGTPECMAPEVILNRGHDKSVDYWALGILMFELLEGRPPFHASDTLAMYNKILKGIDAIHMPSSFSRSASSLIRKLLRINPAKRLGCLQNGVKDIRNHKWFHGFDWVSLRKLKLPAPFIPTVRDHLDVRNFETYTVDRNLPPDDFSDWDKDF